ncbi:bacteriohemerythrin [Meiothermus sp.]|uniref:bacteriohemerythrin n=1 Tax=Meiothermus sp. TaxID=1955249 RepID=UPI0021DD2F2E|nr:hemerythrin domain-containing protein [Meiothermus sp.]GIW33501.1 MAG: hypothetical protein KatS3mg072_0834 [Meiothermus sp.]
MPIQWSEQYEVGDPRTDSQHRNLFDYANQIEQLIEQARAGRLDRQAVEHLFVFLDAYVNTHFAYEELCMALRGCKVAQKNKEAHNKFLEFWTEFNRQHTPQSISTAALENLHATLAGWLTQHICKVDVALRSTV